MHALALERLGLPASRSGPKVDGHDARLLVAKVAAAVPIDEQQAGAGNGEQVVGMNRPAIFTPYRPARRRIEHADSLGAGDGHRVAVEKEREADVRGELGAPGVVDGGWRSTRWSSSD